MYLSLQVVKVFLRWCSKDKFFLFLCTKVILHLIQISILFVGGCKCSCFVPSSASESKSVSSWILSNPWDCNWRKCALKINSVKIFKSIQCCLKAAHDQSDCKLQYRISPSANASVGTYYLPKIRAAAKYKAPSTCHDVHLYCLAPCRPVMWISTYANIVYMLEPFMLLIFISLL